MERRMWLVVVAVLAGPASGTAGAMGATGREVECVACVDDPGGCHGRGACEAARDGCVSVCAETDGARRYPPSTPALVALFVAIAGLLITNLWLMIVVVSVIRTGQGARANDDEPRPICGGAKSS